MLPPTPSTTAYEWLTSLRGLQSRHFQEPSPCRIERWIDIFVLHTCLVDLLSPGIWTTGSELRRRLPRKPRAERRGQRERKSSALMANGLQCLMKHPIAGEPQSPKNSAISVGIPFAFVARIRILEELVKRVGPSERLAKMLERLCPTGTSSTKGGDLLIEPSLKVNSSAHSIRTIRSHRNPDKSDLIPVHSVRVRAAVLLQPVDHTVKALQEIDAVSHRVRPICSSF